LDTTFQQTINRLIYGEESRDWNRC
jgi:hypothetical protein